MVIIRLVPIVTMVLVVSVHKGMGRGGEFMRWLILLLSCNFGRQGPELREEEKKTKKRCLQFFVLPRGGDNCSQILPHPRRSSWQVPRLGLQHVFEQLLISLVGALEKFHFPAASPELHHLRAGFVAVPVAKRWEKKTKKDQPTKKGLQQNHSQLN